MSETKTGKDATYHKEKMLLCKQEEAGFQLNAEQADWRDDTDDEPDDQELEAHYMYIAQIQKNILVQPESINDTYLEEQSDTHITIDSLDMSTNGETVFQDDDDLAKEHDLLASLIDKLKCEIDDSKNRNKFLESSNKTLVDKLKGVNSKTKMHMACDLYLLENPNKCDQSAATPLRRTVASESTNQKSRSTIRKLYEHVRNESRTADILEPMTPRCSTLSNTPLSSNSFAARRDNSIHRRLWVLKAHDGKSQASNYFSEVYMLYSRLKGNDLLTGSRGIDLYSITFQDTSTPNLICLMAKATSSQAWLWHRRLSHLNFDTINLLSKYDIVTGLPKLKFVKDHFCSSCELGKAKHKSFKTKTTPSSKRRFQILHMNSCGPMRVESFNEQFELKKAQYFLNKTLHAYFVQEGIEHQTSTTRTPEQNSVVKRRNRTLVKAARTMLSATKGPLFFWTEAIARTCFTQNRSLVIPRHEKTPYHIISGRKPSVKFFHIFCSLCYIIKDGENLDKMKEKGDACIFVGYSTQSRDYRVYNKRTRVIVETIHVNFYKLPHMASDHVSSDPVPTCLTLSSAVHDADAPDKRQQQNTTQSTTTTVDADIPPLIIQTTPETTNQAPTQTPTVTSTENINQAET
ncbi:retrovirus-related pol polyprotein from transposon TNT 1-94 [Tanacetum coccineum]